MSKRDFLERLEQLLGVLPDEEREEALQYYMDYLEDAGVDNEAQVPADLGSPEEVAARIRAGFSGADSEYTETGYEDVRFENYRTGLQNLKESGSTDHDGIYDSVEDAARAGYAEQSHTGQNYGSDYEKNKSFSRRTWGSRSKETEGQEHRENRAGAKKQTNIWKIICIALICIIAAPIVLPVGFAIIVTIGAVLVALFVTLFSIGVAGLSVLGAGIIIVAAGIAKAFITPAIGLLAAGLGCLITAIGILLTWVIIWCGCKFVPWLIRGIVGILRYPFRKAGVIS